MYTGSGFKEATEHQKHGDKEQTKTNRMNLRIGTLVSFIERCYGNFWFVTEGLNLGAPIQEAQYPLPLNENRM